MALGKRKKNNDPFIDSLTEEAAKNMILKNSETNNKFVKTNYHNIEILRACD